MSTSIPFFFQPVKWRIDNRETPRYIVDGGILSNYPIWKAHDLRFIEEDDAVRTIFIPTGNITTTQFHLNEEQVEFLYQSGLRASEEFIDEWDFNKYKIKFREKSLLRYDQLNQNLPSNTYEVGNEHTT